MNYQNNLIKRKEYFGLVWLAAHHPAKLSKMEIIRMDLSAKCKEISQHATNGKSNKPRFSLLVLSHLMYGLVVILNKKNTYLYNELVALKEMLSITFYHVAEAKEKKKTLKRVKAADKKAITLRETIPEAFSQYSLDTLELDRELDKTIRSEISIQEQYKKITLEEYEQDDLIARTTIIPMEYSYEMDMFGDVQGVSLYDLEQRALLEALPLASPEKRLSRVKAITERTPFRDITNEPVSVVREAHPSRVGPIEETTIMQEAEITKEPEGGETAYSRLVAEFEMPNLFQETVMQQETIIQPEAIRPVVEAPTVVSEKRAEIEEVHFTEEHALRPLPKSISIELREIREGKTKKLAARVNAKERAVTRRHRLLIDNETEIPTTELKNRMTPRTENERELYLEQKKFFREKNTWLATKNDYFMTDVQLFAAPFSKDTKRTNFPMSDYTFFQQHSFRNQLVIQSKLLTSSRVRDDTYFYLTEARERRRELEAGQALPEVEQPPPPQLEFDEQEIQRRETEATREMTQERTIISKGSSAKRRASMRESLITSEPRPGEPEAHIVDQTLAMQQAELTIPQMGPLDSFMETTMMPPPALPVEETSVETDVDDYEKILLEKLGEALNQVVFQELIQTSVLPRKCIQSQKPRRFFAAKMFFVALKLTGQSKIKMEQDSHYAPIYMSLL